MVSNLTTLDSVKNLWPESAYEFAADSLDSQLTNYILRATILLNRLGTLLVAKEGFVQAMDLGAALLVRRLVWADHHPAAVADAAGLVSENVQGLSFTIASTRGRNRMLTTSRNPLQLVGEEIWVIVSDFIDTTSFVKMQTTRVFQEPLLITTVNGNKEHVFDPRLDDDFSGRPTLPVRNRNIWLKRQP